MHIILLKYVQLFCITVFFTNNVNCDELFVENSNDEAQLHQLAACTMNCIKFKQLPFKACYKECYETRDTVFRVKPANRSGTIELLCRDSTSLVVKIQLDAWLAKQAVKTTRHSKTLSILNDTLLMRRRRKREAVEMFQKRSTTDANWIYLIKIEELGGQYMKKRIVYMANESLVTIDNLSPNQGYNITATVYNSKNEFINLFSKSPMLTLESGFWPQKVQSMQLEQFTTSEENLLNAEITWIPGSDMSCFYDIHYYSPAKYDVVTHKIRKPEDLYNYTLTDLTFNKNFTISILARNKRDINRQSNVTYFHLETPKCLDWFASVEYCAPEELNHLEACHQKIGDSQMFQINISWEKPEYEPMYYEVGVYDLFNSNEPDSVNSVLYNVTGDVNELFVPEFKIMGVQYEVMVKAVSMGGRSRSLIVVDVIHSFPAEESWYISHLAVIILIPIVSLALIAVMLLMILNRRAKIKRYKKRIEYFKELEQKAPNDPKSFVDFKQKSLEQILQTDYEWKVLTNDVMELQANDIRILETIGEGAFGLVKKGILRITDTESRVVAIKTLKSFPEMEEVKVFFQEIDLMKSVTEHQNIVSIVGHCTIDLSNLMLVTEYCSQGNLLNYLKKQRERLLRHHDKLKAKENGTILYMTPALFGEKTPENVFNFDTSLIEKDLTFYKTLDRDSQLLKSQTTEEQQPTNLIINRLYDEYDGKVEKTNCTNACKCQVDISNNNNSSPDSDNQKLMIYKNLQNQTRVKVRDCTCTCLRPTTVENKGYGQFVGDANAKAKIVDELLKVPKTVESELLKSKDLLSFTKQIASGMEFLTLNKIVHRDLAARNILVCDDKVVKIADFGLSRDVYQENVYRKTGKGKLPIKWLALESMTHQIYTTHTDVWSYGILLYEIVTLGGNPYPLITTNALLKYLKEGHRMEKPENCSTEMYAIMHACWAENPTDRPIFSNICMKLEEMLKEDDDNKFIDLNYIIENRSSACTITYDSYLKPI